MVSLISRLYDANKGEVLVGGKNVKEYDMEALRNQVSVVLQANVLFSGSIYENLRWGDMEATEEECQRACKLACADEFIQRFPDGYHTHIEQGGTNVSGGQKQRLCIARALLKKPKILILDDSTSAVDTATDAKIRKAFRDEIPGTTKIIIAQRISSVQEADHIIVMENGTVNGFGTHEELVAGNDIYREVYESQTGGAGDFDEKEECRMAGPMRKGPMGPKPKLENPGKLFLRVMNYVFRFYKVHCIVVVICIFLNVFASLQGMLFMKNLIDEYITPFLLSENPDFGPLASAIATVAVFYAIGVISGYVQSRVLVTITQGTLRSIRNELFEHMEKLPIKYFDTHAHGDIMSIYTNDIDTLRQMISQSIPQVINSVVTIVGVLVSMCYLSLPLTGVTMLMVVVMLISSGRILGNSSKYFLEQQKNLGKVNGYIEEMMNGQKVVKVFCHEEESKTEFKKINDELYECANRANKFVNIMGPVNGQLGNLSYLLCAVVGGLLALNGFGGFSLGALASFLTLNKSFNMPINQVSQQFNAVVMALAGADRIFKLMDEEVEVDEGYVTLVNVREENGRLVETKERTEDGHGSILIKQMELWIM